MPPTDPVPPAMPHRPVAPMPAKKKMNGCLIATLIGMVLLIGIFVAGVLAALAFPAFSSVRRKAQQDQARTLAISVVNSCKGYYAEYSRYPLPQDRTTSEVTPLRTDEILTETLLGQRTELNPKKINFLPDLKPVKRGEGPGLLTEGETEMIVDPWGEEYYVLMDVDYSQSIEDPDNSSITTKLNQGVLVFSAGPDKDPSTWNDNVASWESEN